MAFWPSQDGTIQSFDKMYINPIPGQIMYFIKHSVFNNDEPYTHVLAYVEWYKEAPEEIRNYYGKPVDVWYSALKVPNGAASFIQLPFTT